MSQFINPVFNTIYPPTSYANKQLPLNRKLTLAIVITGIVPALVIGFLAVHTTSEMSDDIAKTYVSEAENISDKIDRNLFERYGDVQAFGVNDSVNDKKSWYKVGSENNRIASAANSYANLYGFYLLSYMVDLDGKVVAVNNHAPDTKPIDTKVLYEKNYKAAEWFKESLAGHFLKSETLDGTFVQDVHVDGDVNPTDANGRETNPNGVNMRLDEGVLILNEAGIHWTLAQDTQPGAAKLGAWYHTGKQADVRRDSAGLLLADPLSSGIPQAHAGDWGIYLAAEQIIWREHPADKNDAQGLGVFSRVGYAPPDRNALEYYAEFGVTRTGWLPQRDEDVCGLALAFGGVGSDTREAVRDQNSFNATQLPLPDYELVLEAAYQAKLWPGFSLQPSVQYIAHPGGSAAIADALVVGLRAIVDF